MPRKSNKVTTPSDRLEAAKRILDRNEKARAKRREQIRAYARRDKERIKAMNRIGDGKQVAKQREIIELAQSGISVGEILTMMLARKSTNEKSVNYLAAHLGVTVQRLNEFISGKRTLTPSYGLRLEEIGIGRIEEWGAAVWIAESKARGEGA